MALPPAQDELTAQLGSSSSHFAQSALDASPNGQPATFLLHAATALEQLAKAVLAARHPSFIVARNDFDSLLHICGEPSFARRPRLKIQTITADEAIKRAGHFVPGLVSLGPDLQMLIAVRNGVAHLGEASAADADAALVPYLKASEELRADLDLDRAVYWGGFLDLVDSALRERVEQAQLRVEAALAVARREFEKRFGGLDEKTRKAMVAVIESSYHRDSKYEEQFLECPACGTLAHVWGSLKVEYDEDWDHHEQVLLGVHPFVTFIPSSLECGACSLVLDGRDELEAAGVAEPWVLDDVDEREFFGEDGSW